MFVGILLRDPASDFSEEFESLRHREIRELISVPADRVHRRDFAPILTSPVKREFRYYDFRAFISFCLQYFAHSDT